MTTGDGTAAPESKLSVTLTITHTATEGTLLDGTRKGDGAIDALRAAGLRSSWRWGSSIGFWYVPMSRDRPPKRGTVERSAEALRAAGFTVEVTVDYTPRAMEDAERDRAGRMDDRADALHARATRKAAQADGHARASAAISELIPMGQPILVGHHSERRHRRDLERIDRHTSASIDLDRQAARAEHAASTAETHMQHRDNPGVTSRRLDRLKAERRKVQRVLDGHTRTLWRRPDGTAVVETTEPAFGVGRERRLADSDHLDEQIRYWQSVMDAHSAAGRWIDPATIRKGDEVCCGGTRWYPVRKISSKSVTVGMDDGRQCRLAVDKITGHRPSEDA